MHLSNLCILCLVPNKDLISILLQNNGIVIEEKLKVILFELVNFRPDIPKYICYNCLEYLNTIYKFRLRCLNNIPTLNGYLQKLEVKELNKDLPVTKTEIQCDITDPKIQEHTETNIELSNTQKTCDTSTKSKPNSLTKFEENLNVKEQQLNEILLDNITVKQENENVLDDLNTPYKVFSALNEEKFIPEDNDECSDCHKTFISLRALRRHRLIHTRKRSYQCDICQKTFNKSQNLKRHSLTHSINKPLPCDLCDKSFKQRKNLIQHIKTHKNDRPFECSICKKSFRQQSHLKEHKRVHDNDKPWVCSVCKKTFSQAGNLTIHMRKHTQERPFHCHLCEHKSVSSSDLKSHIKTHTLEKPYECDICHKSFIQPNKLMRHKVIHNKEKKT